MGLGENNAVVETDEPDGKPDGENACENLERQKLVVSGGEISNPGIEAAVIASSGNVEDSVVSSCVTGEVALMDVEEGSKSDTVEEKAHEDIAVVEGEEQDSKVDAGRENACENSERQKLEVSGGELSNPRIDAAVAASSENVENSVVRTCFAGEVVMVDVEQGCKSDTGREKAHVDIAVVEGEEQDSKVDAGEENAWENLERQKLEVSGGEISNPGIEAAVAESSEHVEDSVVRTCVTGEVAMVDVEQGHKSDTGGENACEDIAVMENEKQDRKPDADGENACENSERQKLEVSGGEILNPRIEAAVIASSGNVEASVVRGCVTGEVALMDVEQGCKSDTGGEKAHEDIVVVEGEEQDSKADAAGENACENSERQKLEVSGAEISNSVTETAVAASSENMEDSAVKTFVTEEVALADVGKGRKSDTVGEKADDDIAVVEGEEQDSKMDAGREHACENSERQKLEVSGGEISNRGIEAAVADSSEHVEDSVVRTRVTGEVAVVGVEQGRKSDTGGENAVEDIVVVENEKQDRKPDADGKNVCGNLDSQKLEVLGGEILNNGTETEIGASSENVEDSGVKTCVTEEVAKVDVEQGSKSDAAGENAHKDIAVVENEEQDSKPDADGDKACENLERQKLDVSSGEILNLGVQTAVAASLENVEDSVVKTCVTEEVTMVDTEQGSKSDAAGENAHEDIETQKFAVVGGEISKAENENETEFADSSENVADSVVKTHVTEEVAMVNKEEGLNSKHNSAMEVISSTSEGKQTPVCEVVNVNPESFDEQKMSIAVSEKVAATNEDDFMCSTIEGMETYSFDENLSFSLEELQGNIDSDDLCTENDYIVFADSKSPSELFFPEKDQWDHSGAHGITNDVPDQGQAMGFNAQVSNGEWNLNTGDRIDSLNSTMDDNVSSACNKPKHEVSMDKNGEIVGSEIMTAKDKVTSESERTTKGSAEMECKIRNGGNISVEKSQYILDSNVQLDSHGEDMQDEKENTEGGNSVTSYRASYQLPLQAEGKVGVSDLVWGKVRSHPWWPGQIFDPSDASEKAMKYQKKDCFLVAYFGDRSFAWVDAAQLKSFHSHFSQVQKQSNSEVFQTAVNSALEEVSRRIELGLACPSMPKDVYDKIRFQSIENAGVKKESSVRDGVNESVSPHSLQTGKLVKYMKDLARNPFVGADRLELVVAKAQLLSFYRYKGYYWLPEFEFCGGLVEIDEDLHATPFSKDDEKISETRRGSYHKRKHNLKDHSMYPNKKERSLSELMNGSFDSVDDDEFDYDEKAPTSTSILVSPSSGKKRKPGDSIGDDSSQDGRKTISLAKVSFAAPNVPKPSFKIGECIKRVASQMTGSPSILKNTSERSQKLDGDGFDVSLENHEKVEGKRMTTLPEDYSSLNDLLLQLRLAAQDPRKAFTFSNIIVSFFSDFRNSVVLDRNFLDKTGGKRRKMAHSVTGSPEAFEFEDTNDTYWTDRVIQNGAEEQQQQQQQQPPPPGNGNNNNNGGGGYKFVPVDLGKPAQKGRRSYTRKQHSDNNNRVVGPAKPPGYISENAPAELIMNFSEVGMVPSEMNLNKMFKRFGPLKESDTEVDRESSRARVVFKKCRDAEVAHSSAQKFSIFGPMSVNYQLNYSVTAPFKTTPIATTIGEEFAV